MEENKKFCDLGLSKKVLKAIDDMGFEEPSKIHEQVIPVLLSGVDCIGQAQTGTGKTLAFGAPVISEIEKGGNHVKCIVLAPTRELAVQVNDELVRIAKYEKIRILPIYGGQPIDRQIKTLKRGVDIVVGTPGRVIDLINRRVLDLSAIEFLILDEADEMLNMGFIDDIEEILKHANEDRQTLFFSATMPPAIRKLASKYLKDNSKQVTVERKSITVSTVKQYYYEVKNKDRFETLCRVLDVDEPTAAIIFCKTKRGVDEVVESMQSRGYSVEGMHGDMTQSHRMNTLRKFKEGNLDYLVATDVAARGIDVETVTHVINYDLPQDAESYVHRIGRTGRAGREGVAYTLVTAREYMTLKQIERTTKCKVKRKEIPTIDDIFEAKYKNMIERVNEALAGEDYKKFVPMVQELDEEYNMVDVAAALMSIIYNKEISFDYVEDSIAVNEDKESFGRGRRDRGSRNRGKYNDEGKVRLFLSIGKMDKVNPKQILIYLNEAKVNKNDIGSIDLYDKFSFVDVEPTVVDGILKKCYGKKINGRKVRVEVANRK